MVMGGNLVYVARNLECLIVGSAIDISVIMILL